MLRRQPKGQWVQITGWMFFDAEHKAQSENTAPRRSRNWRATAGETLPITGFEVLAHRPAL